MPPAVAAAIITAAGTTGATIASSKIQSGAAKRAGDTQARSSEQAAKLQAQAAAQALAFQREQARLDQARFEATQRANYDQWAAREKRLGTLGEMLGVGRREIPAYVPTSQGGDMPSSANMPSADLQAVYQGVRAKGAPTANSLDELAAAYKAKGFNVVRPTYNGVPSGNELMVNGQKLKFTVGDVGQPNTGWYDWGTDDSPNAGARRPMPTSSIASYMRPYQPQTPALSIANYFRG